MIEYRHVRARGFGDLYPFGGATVAVDREAGCAGIALCSAKDRFSRKRGREIAENRLELAKKMQREHLGGYAVILTPQPASLFADPHGPWSVASLEAVMLTQANLPPMSAIITDQPGRITKEESMAVQTRLERVDADARRKANPYAVGKTPEEMLFTLGMVADRISVAYPCEATEVVRAAAMIERMIERTREPKGEMADLNSEPAARRL